MQDSGIKWVSVYLQPAPKKVAKRNVVIEFPARKFFTGITANPNSIATGTIMRKW